MTLPLIVSYHTLDPVYTAAMARLQASLWKYGLPHLIRAEEATLPSGDFHQETWLSGCAFKSRVLAETAGFADAPILWLDADAELVQDPRPYLNWLCGTGYDFVAFQNGEGANKRFPLVNSRLCSGTLFFNATSHARKLLFRWAQACVNRGARVYDQELLYEVATHGGGCDWGGVMGNLDPAYCCVPDLMPGVEPVILQHQASRRAR